MPVFRRIVGLAIELGEQVSGIESAVAEEPEARPVELVGTALSEEIYNAPRASTKFC